MLTIYQKIAVPCLSMGGSVNAMEYMPMARRFKAALGEDLRP